jgi:hypothetical protein
LIEEAFAGRGFGASDAPRKRKANGAYATPSNRRRIGKGSSIVYNETSPTPTIEENDEDADFYDPAPPSYRSSTKRSQKGKKSKQSVETEGGDSKSKEQQPAKTSKKIALKLNLKSRDQ